MNTKYTNVVFFETSRVVLEKLRIYSRDIVLTDVLGLGENS